MSGTVGFIADPCGLEEDPRSLVSPPVSRRSNSPTSPLPFTSLAATTDTQGDIHGQISGGLEESAISGLVGLSNLGSGTEATVNNHWPSPQVEEHEKHSPADQALAFAQSETTGGTSLDIPNSTPFSFHSPESQFSVLSKSSKIQLSGREAILLRNYIENVAPWVFVSTAFLWFITEITK